MRRQATPLVLRIAIESNSLYQDDIPSRRHAQDMALREVRFHISLSKLMDGESGIHTR